MPTFCRHNRFVENCPICSKKENESSPVRSAPRRAPRTGGAGRKPGAKAASGMTVRKLVRTAEDGYEHDLAPGLRSSADARRLAEELAFAVARLEELASAPPGLYGEVRNGPDREEAAWLCFLIAYLSPLEDGDPFRTIAAARTSWAGGELPPLDGVELGPRTAHDPARGDAALIAYRAWAARAGSQQAALAGESALNPSRRFDRAFERLSLPGFTRPARYEFLVLVGRLGIADLDPWVLQLDAAPVGPVATAAKRVFGIGDTRNLARRTTDFAHELDVPVAALDLALLNWTLAPEERVTAGSKAVASVELRTRLCRALGLSLEPEPEPAESDAAE